MSKYWIFSIGSYIIIHIIAKIITIFTNGKSLPNYVYLLSEIHRTADKHMKHI